MHLYLSLQKKIVTLKCLLESAYSICSCIKYSKFYEKHFYFFIGTGGEDRNALGAEIRVSTEQKHCEVLKS